MLGNFSFTLGAYENIHELKYVFVVALGLIYLCTLITNGLIITVVCLEKRLHKPMYVFICNLACINVYGGSAVAPFVVARFLTEDYQISWLWCLVQVHIIYTYASSDIANLTLMAYDRYVSICYPLKYERIVTPARAATCVALTWLLPFARVSVSLSVTADIDICGVVIQKVYCDNYSIVKLACADVSYYNKHSVAIMFFVIALPFLIIIYSYLRIIWICLDLSKGGREKLFSTCVPHLASLSNFILGTSFELLQSCFDMRHVPWVVRVVLSLYVLVLSPFINPVIYGMRTKAIKDAVVRMTRLNRRRTSNH